MCCLDSALCKHIEFTLCLPPTLYCSFLALLPKLHFVTVDLDESLFLAEKITAFISSFAAAVAIMLGLIDVSLLFGLLLLLLAPHASQIRQSIYS